MSVTVAVSSPAPGKISFVPGAGAGPVLAAEAMQVGEGESGDFAALMREATGAPASDSQGLKPGKSASPSEGKKAKKDKIKGDEALPVQTQQPEPVEAAKAPVIAPVTAYTPPLSADGSAAVADDAVTPIIVARGASFLQGRSKGEGAESGAEETVEVDPAKAVPAESPVMAESETDTPSAQPATGKKRSDASPEPVPEPKVRAGKPQAADAIPTTKASVAPQPSDEIGRSVSKAPPQETSPSRSQAASPPGEPTPSRAARQRSEEGAVASPSRSDSEAASQPVRAGEATALLAVARKADKRAPLPLEEGAPVSRVSDGKAEFPAKGAGTTQASAVAVAAVQSGPPSAARASGPQPKAAGKQADGPSEVREAPPVGRPDTPAASGSTAAAQPLPTASAATGAVSTGGVALSGALGQQVVDLGVSGRWIDDIAREIATVAANPGQGSFRIASASLGAVRVDIAPGKDGSDVLMTVDNDAARAALSTDTDRLMQDARLASVRLGEVRVERASAPAEGARSDTGTSQQQQQGGGHGTSGHGQTAMGQGSGQGGQHSAARPDAGALMNQNNGGNSPKAPFIKSVLQDSGTLEQFAPDRGRSPDRARYA